MDAVSSTAQLAIIAGVFGAVNAIIAAVVLWITTAQTARISKEAREDARMTRSAEILAATKIKEVKETLAANTTATEAKLDSIAKTGEDTHTLVNANMGAALNVNRISTRRLADITNNQADIEAADKAEELYLAHERKQATVDAAAGKKAAEQ